jgi:ribosomal protein L11 methyltransferase
MHVLTLHCRYGAIEPLTAELYGRGTLGIQETELPGGLYQLDAWFDTVFPAEGMEGFTGWQPAPAAADWQSVWEPVPVGEKLWLAPAWQEAVPPEGRIAVKIHPGQGSGTSASEPTLLMLEALERELRPGDRVADIGTGSGILTAAAHALGARQLLACDVDATSAAESAASFREDGIGASVWCGSPRSLASGVATLAVANLNAITLQHLAPELERILAAGGRLLVGGFTERNRALLEKAFSLPQ